MITDLMYVGRIYTNCGPTGAQQNALSEEQSFSKMATNTYQSVIGNMTSVFNDIQNRVGAIAAAGVGQQGWTPAESAARNAQVINQAAAANKQLQASISEKGAVTSGGGAGLTNGATLANEGEAEASVLDKESSGLQENTAENYEEGANNYWKATGTEAAIPGEEAKVASEAAEPVTQAQGEESNQANQNAAASSSWMGLVGGLADAGISKAKF